MSATQAAVPLPPKTDRGFPAHAEVGPLISRRISDLLAALVALEDPDPTHRESPMFAVPLGDGAIALYADESTSDKDPLAGLIGWVQQVDAHAWSFAGYVREPKPAKPR